MGSRLGPVRLRRQEGRGATHADFHMSALLSSKTVNHTIRRRSPLTGRCLITNHDKRDQSRPSSRGHGASASDESSWRVRFRWDCAAVGQGRPGDRGKGMPDLDPHLKGNRKCRPGARTELVTNPATVETQRAIAHVARRGRVAIHLADTRGGMRRLGHRVRRHRHLASGQGDDQQGTKPKSAECTHHVEDTCRNSLRRQPRSHRRDA